jgi:outer membrane protein assembly factor BamB
MSLQRLSFVAVLLLCSFTLAGAQSSNWPGWRGPSAGVSTEKNLPVEWDQSKNILWKTPLAGRGHSSPIIWGNKVFLTTAIEGPMIPGKRAVQHIRGGQVWVHPDSVGGDRSYTLKVVCLNRDTGKIVWEQTAYEGTVHDDRHRKNTYASSTPATDGRYVFAFFEAEGLYCYDLDGRLVWKTSLGKIAKMGMGHGMSPVLFEDLVIIQCDQEDGGPEANSFIAALDKKSGREVWRVSRTHRKSWATPLLVKSAARWELVTSGAETIIAYDPGTGKELWRSKGVESHAIPSPVVGHNMVFVTAGSQAKRAVAIKLGGSGDLTDTPGVVWKYQKGTAYVPSPILFGDYLYLMSDKGLLTCLDAKTGEVKYEGGRVPVPATFTASPVAFDDKILLTSEDGDTFLIKAGPSHEVLRTNSIGEPVYASPAISQGKIFIRGEKHLYCISNLSGGKGRK